MPDSCGDFPPLRQRGGAAILEVVAGDEVAFEVEVVMDRSMGRIKLLQGLDVPKRGDGALPPACFQSTHAKPRKSTPRFGRARKPFATAKPRTYLQSLVKTWQRMASHEPQALHRL
jgi:hypothetical protein